MTLFCIRNCFNLGQFFSQCNICQHQHFPYLLIKTRKNLFAYLTFRREYHNYYSINFSLFSWLIQRQYFPFEASIKIALSRVSDRHVIEHYEMVIKRLKNPRRTKHVHDNFFDCVCQSQSSDRRRRGFGQLTHFSVQCTISCPPGCLRLISLSSSPLSWSLEIPSVLFFARSCAKANTGLEMYYYTALLLRVRDQPIDHTSLHIHVYSPLRFVIAGCKSLSFRLFLILRSKTL